MRVTDTHIFFWGEEFSNWYDCVINYKGHVFDNTEQIFMWEKAMFFKDTETAGRILKVGNPSMAKKLGRQVKNFDSVLWLLPSYQFMVDANVEKFTQNEYLKKKLLETGTKMLVEASPYDTIWGIGLGEADDAILDEKNWKGLNLLGKALMDVRNIIKNQ